MENFSLRHKIAAIGIVAVGVWGGEHIDNLTQDSILNAKIKIQSGPHKKGMGDDCNNKTVFSAGRHTTEIIYNADTNAHTLCILPTPTINKLPDKKIIIKS